MAATARGLETGPSHDWKSDSVQIILRAEGCLAAPPNTIASLEAAFQQGADGVQIDVRRTLDGALILCGEGQLLDSFGPGARVEDLTLGEVQSLDAGARWARKWKGVRIPLLRDALAYAKARGLKVILQLHGQNLEADARPLLAETGASSLVLAPASLAAGSAPIEWADGWTWADGGEENPLLIRRLLSRSEGHSLLMDDCRALASLLGRKPKDRPSSRWAGESRPPKSREIPARLDSESEPEVRRALWRLAEKMDPKALDKVKAMAEGDPRPWVRLDAVWALGAAPGSESFLEKTARSAAASDAKGVEHYADLLQTAACCSLARLGAADALKSLVKEPGFLGTAAVIGAVRQDRSRLVLDLLDSVRRGPSAALSFALGCAREHPEGVEICRLGLNAGRCCRKQAVFALAEMEPGRLKALESDSDPAVQSGLKLARDWARWEP